MSDLFSSMRDPEQLPTPPVEDVRRRGDSLRRRRQTLQAGGVAAVVAAVALAVVGLSGGFTNSSSPEPPIATQSSSPTPTESSAPPPSRITTIPADVDLGRGWEDGDGAGEEELLRAGPKVQWLSEVVACDTSHSPADESTDHLGVRYSVPGLTRARDLRAFADDATAQRVAEDYVSWFVDCPSFSLDGGASETRNEVTSTMRRLGDQAWVVSQTYWTDGVPQLGESILVVTRVGNSVLVGWWYGEGPGATDPAASQRNADALLEELRPITVDLSCTFGNAGGC